ncbi:ATP-binding cassette, subfamily B, MsbA [Thermodesulfobium acidiphilum]|uniref:ATP-binding cassette, subfamily B, MsbA n=1 Tax=Thermodesulfobium acidiphilum TaxID=1794699 RepID=A0A2R4W1L1_THEAF|nr:ABC transporter ATP-binding protein [Thermodesulfobium acidiphilum]AWB10707.1 ATP-binding cassette, subfamily B, MsbA [Thermodesulfobium acidiphilum]
MKDIYFRLLKYLKPYVKYFVLALFFMCLVSAIMVAIPWTLKVLIDSALIKKNAFILNILALSMIGLYIIKGILSFCQNYLMIYITNSVISDIREQFFTHMQLMPLEFFKKHSTGELMSRLTNDTFILQQVFSTGLVSLVLDTLTLIGVVCFIFYIDWKLTMATIFILPLAFLAVQKFGRRLKSVSYRIQERSADVFAVLQEILSSIKIVHGFATYEKESERFKKINRESVKAVLKAGRLNSIYTPVMELLGAMGIAAVFWYGGYRVINGHMTIGDLMAFIGYIGIITTPVRRMGSNLGNIQQAMAAAHRIFSVLDIEPSIKDKEDAIEIQEIKGMIEFENVWFKYPDDEEYILKGLSFRIMPGQVFAIVGPSGAGKTTIIDLIMRFYDPQSGSIKIDGYDVRDLSMRSLRRHLGLVPQDIILFNTTISENISYGKNDATTEDIIWAAKISNAHDFIDKMEKGYDTVLGERGVRFSGGERQRISIARAVIKNPKIFLLDEATSNLDASSESQFQEALKRVLKGRTTIIVAHRLSTVIFADKILYLENGKIVEEGTHSELMSKENGKYRMLFELQTKENMFASL